MKTIALVLLFTIYDLYGVTVFGDVFHFKLIAKFIVLFGATLYSLYILKHAKIRIPVVTGILTFFYLFFIFLSSIFSISISYCISQSVLLLLLILFVFTVTNTVSYNELIKVAKILSIYMSIITICSIIGYYFFFSNTVYIQEGANRLHGVYGQPAQLSFSCALNIGLVFLAFRNGHMRLLVIMLSLVCLILTGARTYVVAVILAASAIVLLHSSFSKLARFALCSALGCLMIAFSLGGITERILKSDNRYLRPESITNFTGRTTLWKRAIPVAVNKPFGSGFCLGGGALLEDPDDSKIVIRHNEDFDPLTHSTTYKSTLHNGYIQSLTDLGVMGFLVYCAIFLKGFLSSLAPRNRVQFPAIIFIFFIIAIGNMAESIVMSPTSTSSVMFWLTWFLLIRNAEEDSLLKQKLLSNNMTTTLGAGCMPVALKPHEERL